MEGIAGILHRKLGAVTPQPSAVTKKRLCHLQAFEMRKTSLRTPGSIRVPLCVGLGPAETLAGPELIVRQVQL